MPLDELYARFRSGPDGIGRQEARDRLNQFGPNALRSRARTPEVFKFLRQFKNLFAALLITGGGLAYAAATLEPGQGYEYIATALFIVVLLNAVFTYLQEWKSEQILASFRRLLPQLVTVVRDGAPLRIDATEIVPGDIITLQAGDKICADARLIEQHQLKIDLSSLTGESEPQLRHLECTHSQLLESRNMVFSGALVQSGDGKAIVHATGMGTQIGRIAQLTEQVTAVETPIHRELRYFIRIISTIAITLGVLFFLVGLMIGIGRIGSLIFAIGIIVANVPEGLLPTVTLALSMASRRMARKNALLKNLESVETLGGTTVICTDKTGTLTQNRMSVNTVILQRREYGAFDREILDDHAFPAAWGRHRPLQ